MNVITARQIKQMDFRTLTDVLDTVPGIHISMDETGEKEIAVRGILDTNSYKVKVLIDGHYINDPQRGSAMFVFDDLVVENAKRIDIIRGYSIMQIFTLTTWSVSHVVLYTKIIFLVE